MQFIFNVVFDSFGFLAHTHCAIMMPCTTNAGGLVLGPGPDVQE